MKKEIYPKLSVVGAGPGDIDLITVKGINALGEANVILYDAWVSRELFKYAPIDALKIFVGKSKDHSYTQDQINKLIVEYAYTYGYVVSLKGGDPFVFGRGQEEIKYAELLGIETAVVPGISTSLGVATSVGIPLTKNGISESFWVIAGANGAGKISKDVKLAAKADTTVVILNGLNRLSEIAEIYRKAERHETAIAIIQNGTLQTENLAIGTIETIEAIAAEEKIKAPAVIVIGEVVKQHTDFPTALVNLKYLFN